MSDWQQSVDVLQKVLLRLSISDCQTEELCPDAAFELWQHSAVGLRNKKGTIFFVGNGASASMASHFAADLAKNAGIRTEVFSDLALLTALANDFGYEQVFAEPLRLHMQKNDILVAVSSSGQSANIINAVLVAKEKNGMVVTLSAMAADNPLRQLGDLNFYVAAQDYGLAESAHAVILHHWMDLLELKG